MDRTTTPSVLMIAYHFPPLRGSSGIQRTLRFCRYLPEFGWNPIVLTAHPRAYETTSDDLLKDLPTGLQVERAFALNTARHLAVAGRYPGWLAIPDRWITWWIGGVITGLSLMRRTAVKAIFSTYPIATAHLIGLTLQRLTGLPWIADFRDPMAQEGYPADPAVWKSYRWIEEQALRRCSYALFTSPGAIRDYRVRYPDVPAKRYVLLENGYDEEVFSGLCGGTGDEPKVGVRRLVVLHSGIVYTSERDPTQLFEALGRLKRDAAISAREVEFRFRASANDSLLERLAIANDVSDIVTLAPPVPYRDALAEMMDVDALMVMQAANCNSQIPAKAYEYIRAGRPTLVLADPAGDTAGLMARAGIEAIVPLDSTDAIAGYLPDWLAALRAGTAGAADAGFAAGCTRQARTRQLAELLNSVGR